MKTAFAIVIAALLAGCANTQGTETRQVYDRKYNETRIVRSDSAGTFVGTSAARPRNQLPMRQHP